MSLNSKMIAGTLALACLGGWGSGCARADAPAAKSPAEGSAYTNDEVVALANELVGGLEMPAEKQVKVLKKLQNTLQDPKHRPALYDKIQKYGITGVVAYRLGEGGAVLTVKSGKALARLKGEPTNVEYKLSGTDLGVQVAASREWGVGLVLGSEEGVALEGKYRGTQKAVTAGAGAGAVVLRPKGGGFEIVLMGAGAGVSLDVSGARLKIKRV